MLIALDRSKELPQLFRVLGGHAELLDLEGPRIAQRMADCLALAAIGGVAEIDAYRIRQTLLRPCARLRGKAIPD